MSVLGLALSLVANGLSPKGLSLTRDYFPVKRVPVTVGPGHALDGSAASIPVREAPSLDARLREQRLEPIADERMLELFTDARYAQELVVFVDARDDRHFQEGHIPGAYRLDRYRPEELLPLILPVCQNAEFVVVYCNGGDCDDSLFAAMALRDAGVPAERIGVYSGGITSWEKRGNPIETGDRGSGAIRPVRSAP